MKKSTALLLVVCLTVGLFVGCGNDVAPSIETDTTTESSAVETSTGETTLATEEKETTVQTVETAETTEATTVPETTEETQETTQETTEPSETTKPAEKPTEPTTAPTEPATESTTAPSTEPSTEPTTNQGGNQQIGPDVQFVLKTNSVTLYEKGETVSIYEGLIAVSEITWTTDNAKIATIKDGVVTAVSAGSTKVYGKYNGVRIACSVKCEIAEETVPETTAPPAPADPNAPVLTPPAYQSVSSSFFDDALFIGDSVTEGLRLYCNAYGGLGGAKFASRASYGTVNESGGAVRLQLYGVSTTVDQIVANYNPGKIFIMLGTNELYFSTSTLISYWNSYLAKVRSAAPNAQIYIQSVFPIYTNGQNSSTGVTNKNVEALNVALRQFAANNGCIFLDIAPYMKDSTGGLARAYTSDRYVHMSNDGCRAWIKVLYAICG